MQILLLILIQMKNKFGENSYPRWLEAVIIVSFDIDQGQKISQAVPNTFTAQRQKQISMLAFPDSNSFTEYEGIFKYLFKTKDDSFGFVCFKQKKDASNKRGYSQKSFVILTKLPFLRFFQKLAEFLVFKLFTLEDEILYKELERIYNQSDAWPLPEPLTNHLLAVLQYQIPIEIPNYIYDFNGSSMLKVENFPSSRKDKQTTLEQIVNQEILLQFGRFQEVKLTEHFDSSYQQLWTIWESVILNRPLLLMGDNPHRASQSVLAAISLLNPLQYGGDYYPYVTVYDTHLNELQQAENDVVFGATNPLFFKLFAKDKITILPLGSSKIPKHLKPLRELFVKSKYEQQKFVNESALRKFFYKINCGLISIVDEYVELQTNDLKFLNEKDFLRFVRKRQGENVLTQIFDGKKYIQLFWEEFIKSLNFAMLLRSKNIVRQRC